MSRIEDNKLLKRTNLMETAFQLFTSQGIAKTSIADIAQRSGVAKGTFYLYFKDKYDLHEKLVIDKSEQLFRHALEHSGYQSRKGSADKLIAIIDDVLYQLQKDPLLLQFINKNLSGSRITPPSLRRSWAPAPPTARRWRSRSIPFWSWWAPPATA